MKVAITARMRNGYLWEAVQKLGSVKALAEHLGIGYGEVLGWLNFGKYPYLGDKSKRNWAEIERKLCVLTGALLDDIFPPELKEESFTRRQKIITAVQEVQISALTAGEERLALTDGANELQHEVENIELSSQIEQSLLELTPREAKVLKMRFSLDGEGEKTFEEIAKHFNVTRERIRQIEARALNKLRHPARSRNLKPFSIDNCEHEELNPAGRCIRCYSIIAPIITAEDDSKNSLENAIKAREAREQGIVLEPNTCQYCEQGIAHMCKTRR